MDDLNLAFISRAFEDSRIWSPSYDGRLSCTSFSILNAQFFLIPVSGLQHLEICSPSTGEGFFIDSFPRQAKYYGCFSKATPLHGCLHRYVRFVVRLKNQVATSFCIVILLHRCGTSSDKGLLFNFQCRIQSGIWLINREVEWGDLGKRLFPSPLLGGGVRIMEGKE